MTSLERSARYLLYCLWVLPVVNAFSLVPFHGRSSRHSRGTQKVSTTRLRSSSPMTTSTSNTNNTSTVAVETIQTLAALLDRQKEQVMETERLLQIFQQSSINNVQEITQSSPSLAASMLLGFNYGFKSRSEGSPSLAIQREDTLKHNIPGYEGPPANVWALGREQFMRNLRAMWGEYRHEEDITLTPEQEAMQDALQRLTLNATAIWEREFADGPIQAPIIIKVPYLALCYFLDYVFDGKYVPARFFFLETVARMPYFSYISLLHLYETLGFWRRSADMKRVHFAEEVNEFQHLLIMESLGGDQMWWTRFLAQHSAIAYFFVLSILFLMSPSLSYRFSELLETHAVNTYGQFLDENEELLRTLPPSMAAIEYYSFGSWDAFYAEFQTKSLEGFPIRRPGESISSLYDVFSAIRADEADHVHTMGTCLDPESSIRTLSLERRLALGLSLVAAAGAALSSTPEDAELTFMEQILEYLGRL